MYISEKQPEPDALQKEWTTPEKWVWEKICGGEVADFNLRFEKEPDPSSAEAWTGDRILSAKFLETILLHESCRKALHRKGVRIVGAWIKEKLDLANSNLDAEWWLEKSRLEQDVVLDFLRTNRNISFEHAVFAQNLSFKFAKLERELSLQGTQVLGKLDMNTLFGGGSLFMKEGKFKEVDMIGAKITGEIDLTKIIVAEKLGMSSLAVGTNLYIRAGAEFNDVNISNTKVGGQLELNQVKVKNNLNLESITVNESVYLTRLEIAGVVSINYATINGSLFISDSKLSHLDLGGTSVRGELLLGALQAELTWTENAFLNLRNTQVGTLEDGGKNSWPANIDFDGFTCARLGGPWNLYQNNNKNIADREAEWFAAWLAKDKSYSPQPYQYFASLLKAMGHSEKSDALLYAAKDRERQEAYKDGNINKFIGLSLLNWTIGYGIGGRYFLSLLWVLALTLIGVGVLNTMTAAQVNGFWYNFFFSFDILLPIIELNSNYKLNFGGWQLYYFYFHKLMGFLLGSFVLAGLSGITKK